ncbi:hypothetical protein ACRTDR_03395 [Shewanella algae]
MIRLEGLANWQTLIIICSVTPVLPQTKIKDEAMYLSNAERWAQICDRQVELMGKLSEQFPERREQLQHLTHSWQDVKQQVRRGDTPHIPPLR